MDLLRIASRVAARTAASKLSFNGVIHTAFDGENNGGDGDITIDGDTYKVSFSASGNYSEYSLDGKDVPDGALKTVLDDFFAENWPEDADPAWQPDPNGDPDGEPKTAHVSF